MHHRQSHPQPGSVMVSPSSRMHTPVGCCGTPEQVAVDPLPQGNPRGPPYLAAGSLDSGVALWLASCVQGWVVGSWGTIPLGFLSPCRASYRSHREAVG